MALVEKSIPATIILGDPRATRARSGALRLGRRLRRSPNDSPTIRRTHTADRPPRRPAPRTTRRSRRGSWVIRRGKIGLRVYAHDEPVERIPAAITGRADRVQQRVPAYAQNGERARRGVPPTRNAQIPLDDGEVIFTIRSLHRGISCHSRPSRTRAAFLPTRPPHCLKKKAGRIGSTPSGGPSRRSARTRQASRSSRAQTGDIGRAPGPLSPPAKI